MNPDVPGGENNDCRAGNEQIHLASKVLSVSSSSRVLACYQGAESTRDALTCPFPASCLLTVHDRGDVKADRWARQPDNRLLSVCCRSLHISAPRPPCLRVIPSSLRLEPGTPSSLTFLNLRYCYLPIYFMLSINFPPFLPFLPFPSRTSHSPFFYPLPLWPHANRGLH